MLHSGAASRIRPAGSGHRGQQGLVRTGRTDSKVTNIRKNPQEPSQQNRNIFSIKLSSGQNAGERNKTARPSQQTRELFSIFSPTPLVAASSNSFAPHCGSHSRPRACTRIQPFFDYCLHRSPPPSIPIRMWQLGVKTLHLFAVHRHHPKRETQLIDFSAAKPLRFGGTAWVNFCFFPSSPESSPVSR